MAKDCFSVIGSIAGGGHADSCAEVLRKRTLVDEATLRGNLARCQSGFLKHAGCREDTRFYKELLWRDAKGGLKTALQLPQGLAANRRDISNDQWLGIIPTDDFNGLGNRIKNRPLPFNGIGTAQQPHHAGHVSAFVI